jgi:hypothetical protein
MTQTSNIAGLFAVMNSFRAMIEAAGLEKAPTEN